MVNLGFGWSSVVGISLILAGAGLYFLRSMRPALARDQDIFFAAISLLCGGILFFQGWRLDPILQFAQFLSAGSAIWFATEAIRLRGITTEQAKRSTPVVDDERPVSRVYRAELDDLNTFDDRGERISTSRRIRGTRDARGGYDDDYRDERRRSSRDSERYDTGERSRRSRAARPLPPDRSESRSAWDDDPSSNASRSRDSEASSYNNDYRSNSPDLDAPTRPRRPRSSEPSPRRRRGSSERPSDFSTDYVDYQPIDYPDE